MTSSNGPIVPHRPGGPARVIQGFFPGGQPRLAQPATAGTPPPVATPPRPNPLQAHPATVQPAIVPGRPGAIGPGSKPGFPANKPQPILPTAARAVAVQPFTAAKPMPPQPILPQAPGPAAVQLHAGNAFRLPGNFTLKPRGSGQPLPEPVQKKMEAFFNTNFADVRVHVGHEAPLIGALAFTHGTDLYFAPGQYNPQSTHGQQLLGHELTHVLQQRAGRVRNPLGAGVAVVQDPALESEAERMGVRAASTAVPVQAKTAAVSQLTQHSPVLPGRSGTALVSGQKASGPVQPVARALQRRVGQSPPGSSRTKVPALFSGSKPTTSVIQALLDGNLNAVQNLAYGLVRGFYEYAGNKAELHVEAKGAGPGLQRDDMLAALRDVHQAFVTRQNGGGPQGSLEMHPNGPAVVKMMVEGLAGVFGGMWNYSIAMGYQLARKNLGSEVAHPNRDTLSESIWNEHFAFLDSLVDKGVWIEAMISGQQNLFGTDITADTANGRQRLAYYKTAVRNGTYVGLTVKLTTNQVATMISKL